MTDTKMYTLLNEMIAKSTSSGGVNYFSLNPSEFNSSMGCTLDPTINGLQCVGSYIVPDSPFPGGGQRNLQD